MTGDRRLVWGASYVRLQPATAWSLNPRRANFAAALIGLAWALWVTALWLPAIRYKAIDSGHATVASGMDCLLSTFDPMMWLYSPLVLVYLAANLVLALTPVALFRPRRAGFFMFMNLGAFVLALASASFGTLLVGSMLWMASFLCASCSAALLWSPQFMASRRAMRGQCVHCGYDLRGASADSINCPECGEPIDQSRDREGAVRSAQSDSKTAC